MRVSRGGVHVIMVASILVGVLLATRIFALLAG